MSDEIYAIESAFLLGQSLLVLSILLLRKDSFGLYLPLCFFFMANAINQLPAMLEPYRVSSVIEPLAVVSEILSIPAFLVLSPALWLYVRQLTSEQANLLKRRDLIHFIPTAFALGIVTLLLVVPVEIRASIFGDASIVYNELTKLFSILIFLLMIIWAIQVIFYVKICMQRIYKYRKHLKDNFANTEGKELNWLSALMVLLLISVLVFVPDFIVGFPRQLDFIPLIMDLALFWFLGVYGLIQKPALANVNKQKVLHTQSSSKSSLSKNKLNEKVEKSKYAKSALTTEDMQRIADKLLHALTKDDLFLNNSLSLTGLSNHIQVPTNYVSQTLNSHIGLSFFDFVNKARIKFAMPLLVKNNQTVLDIAYQSGFNSRSSFYTAFKKETGVTPSQYTKTNT